jgi:predicted TIM-barrel fold metal-dependent hydrolase
LHNPTANVNVVHGARAEADKQANWRESAIRALSASQEQTRPSTTMRRPSGQPMVIDCHAHLHHHSFSAWEEMDRQLIEAADKLGIDQLCSSILTPRKPSTAEGFRECNDWVGEAVLRFPGRVLGYCYVNPGYPREAIAEIRRCLQERGFMGAKLDS